VALDDETHPLRSRSRPAFESGEGVLRIVDLFSGCGGITLGVAQAARELDYALDIPLAVDCDAQTTATYALNFPKATVCTELVDKVFDGRLGTPPTEQEQAMSDELGLIHALVGGPPCQGHSDLNNQTRRDDPRNALYARMARAAEVIRSAIVVIENVPTVMHDKSAVVDTVIAHLTAIGYSVASEVMKLEHLGVAQRRRRHVLLAVDPSMVRIGAAETLRAISDQPEELHDLRWAIGDLANVEDTRGIDKRPRASEENLVRMRWLLENNEHDLPNHMRPVCHQDEHSYKSMYGRLTWGQPAQTITSGYGSIGQGRYMHPDQPRALTPHEAARLQGFPDYFQFEPTLKRDTLATMIGNAVPPALTRAIFSLILTHASFRPIDESVGRVRLPIC
jgi:DNA (cytosine-5)-methyltransferase 1